MKFINYLSGVENASSYPMFSLMVFVIFFVVLLFLVSKMRKESIQTLKNIPFEDDGVIHSTENSNSKI